MYSEPGALQNSRVSSGKLQYHGNDENIFFAKSEVGFMHVQSGICRAKKKCRMNTAHCWKPYPGGQLSKSQVVQYKPPLNVTNCSRANIVLAPVSLERVETITIRQISGETARMEPLSKKGHLSDILKEVAEGTLLSLEVRGQSRDEVHPLYVKKLKKFFPGSPSNIFLPLPAFKLRMLPEAPLFE